MDPSILPFVKDWGPTSLLTFVVALIVLGRLVSAKVLESRLADRDKIIEYQQKTIDNLTKVVDSLRSTSTVSIESAKTVEQMVRSLPSVVTTEGET